MHVGWLRRWAAEATTEPFSLWRLVTLNSWTLTPEWASSHHPSSLQMNQSTIVFMALCLVAGINAGLFNHRIQSHHNNVHKVIIPSTQHAALPQYFYWLYSRGPAMNCGEASDLTATSTTSWRGAALTLPQAGRKEAPALHLQQMQGAGDLLQHYKYKWSIDKKIKVIFR